MEDYLNQRASKQAKIYFQVCTEKINFLNQRIIVLKLKI